MNAEAMRNAQNLACLQRRLNRGLVEISLCLVRSQNLDPVRTLGRFRRGEHGEAVRIGLLRARPARVQTDDYVEPAVAQVLRLRVPLAAVAENTDCLAFKCGRISVVLVENGGHSYSPWGCL